MTNQSEGNAMKLSRKIIVLGILLVVSLLLAGLSQAVNNTSSLLPGSYLPIVFKDFHIAQLAYKTNLPDTMYQLYIFRINEDGSGRKELLSTIANTYFSFNWSPDGSKLVIQSALGNNSDIFVMNADGTGFIQLTYDPAKDEFPTWSGDGNHIAFQSGRNGSPQLFVMNADGKDVIQLSDLANGCTLPYWSPIGDKIIFDNYGNDKNGQEIYIVNSDGSGLLRLTDNAYYDVALGWSPDGTKILFLSNRDQGGLSGVNDLYVMNSDGTNPVRLTTTGSVEAASWSPDGAKIAYSQLNNPRGLFIINPDGSGATTVQCQASPIFTKDFSWSPDASKIAFTRYLPNESTDGVYIARVDNSICLQITYNPAARPRWRPNQ